VWATGKGIALTWDPVENMGILPYSDGGKRLCPH
jgi:hypothetical protein